MTKLTIKEAAAHFDVSERTIRRWIAAGELHVERIAMAHGLQVLIHVDDTPDVRGDATGDTTARVGVTGPIRDDTSDVTGDIAVVRALEMVDRLQQQNLHLAGRIGWLEAQLQQAQEQVRMLTDAQHAPEQPAEPEPTTQPAEQPPLKRLPWWRRLFADI